MNISVTQREFEAILFATSQVEGDLEAATNEDYIKDAKGYLNNLYSLCRKYKNEYQIMGLIAESKKQGNKIKRSEARRLLKKYKVLL